MTEKLKGLLDASIELELCMSELYFFVRKSISGGQGILEETCQ